MQIEYDELAIVYLIQELKTTGQALPLEAELRGILYAQFDNLDVTKSFDAYWPDSEDEAYKQARAVLKSAYPQGIPDAVFREKNPALYLAHQQSTIARSKIAFEDIIQRATQTFKRLEHKARRPISALDLEFFVTQQFKRHITVEVIGLKSLGGVPEKLADYKKSQEQKLKSDLSLELFFKKIALYVFLFCSPFASAESTEVIHNKIEVINEVRENLERKDHGLKDLKQWKNKEANANKINAHRRNTLLSWTADRTKRTDKTATMKILDKYTEPLDQSSSTSRKNTT